MTAPILRDYQQEVVEKVRYDFSKGARCPLVVSSTGSGKTVMFCYIAHGAALKGNPVLIAAHRKEIIRQISLSLAQFGVPHQVIAPPDKVTAIKVAHFRAFGRSYVDSSSTTIVGSVQTIVTRFDQVDAIFKRGQGRPLIIMDEAHHVVEGNTWGRVMDRYVVKGTAYGLETTATPRRLDGRGLGAGYGGYADTLIQGPSMSWLMENGYLSKYVAFSTPNPVDMTGVRMRMGDFVASDGEERFNKPSITGDAIEHYLKRANGMRGIVFGFSIKHSMDVAAMFNAAGIPAAHIDGGISDYDRDKAIMDFADGKLKLLSNVNLMGEGFDLASIAQKPVTIDCMIDLAKTESLVNFMQRGGRVLRPYPGKIAVLLDHAGNFEHGMLEEEREWSLTGSSGSRADNDNEPDVLVRKCPKCFSNMKPVPICSFCGFEFPIQERKVLVLEGELTAIDQEAIEARRKRQEQGRAQTVEQMIATLGYSRGRAEKIVQARQDKADLVDEVKAALATWYQARRLPIKTVFGVFSADVPKLKPKQLMELLQKIQDDIPRDSELSAAS